MASRAAFPATPVMNPGMNSPGHPRMAAMNPAYRAMSNPANQYPRPGIPPGRNMPMGGMGSMGSPMPGPSYGGTMTVRPSMPQTAMDPARKRLLQQQQVGGLMGPRRGLKRRKMADKVLPQRIRDLVPESQAYMDLLAFERKLDQTIARKRMEIQEAIKKPITQKRKLRIYISNTCTPAKPEGEESEKVASWELRVEGKLLEDPGKQKRKFSSFFKSLVIELDKELYGPDNHLVEWHRMPTTQETDGFQVKRPGDVSVKCTLLLMLDHQPPQYKLDPRLARLLGVHTQTRASIMQALWLYIKNNKLQDCHEKEYINCNRYFRQIFACSRMRFSEIPMKLAGLLQHPDPIVINHVISVDPNDQKKMACFDIDVEVDDPLKSQMSSFLSSTTNQQEIAALEMKIHETIESINQLKTQRDFMLSFSNNPQDFIQDWLKSQSRDLKLMTDTAGNPEEERKSEFYQAPWIQEAVGRYIFSKVQQRRQELEQVLGIRLT
ncbi:SWI/SNF-related matrix-associated actin-dependent regulator of chromatin subfamily D member 2 isoform X1 [Neoarius graeffei]|uniref:SWI/SNF-related matrix-associated actin-dependent regulator of chromatin subfamily D member 2 isoform X1 n=2 Tax=Neoarius graeffei TaxID=443677 RepID=UPI00298C540B|nr:SWI/SNF-related matrix-associated actin-dependent regulator of chromatin subfamily D member 2 isoform X1 [Neoarius graeffei]XP_060795326.1 SWI/SNF-related matrix-associated actin-dependent regulator of chromatin subfamily D member 2 isoform X1 [Neoarius graeffei]